MRIYNMTYITLDIIWGVGWWILKKTKKGVDLLIYPQKSCHNLIREYPQKLYDQIEDQKKQIATLTKKIEVISNYFETLSVKR